MAGFLAGFAGVPSVEIDGAVSASCGPHALTVLTPDAFKQRFSTPHPDLSQGPRLAAIVIATSGGQIGSTDPAQSAGLAISWVRA